MLESREEIIAEALLVLIDTGAVRADFFTARHVLMAAKIGEEEIKKAQELYQKQNNMQEILKSILI